MSQLAGLLRQSGAPVLVGEVPPPPAARSPFRGATRLLACLPLFLALAPTSPRHAARAAVTLPPLHHAVQLCFQWQPSHQR